MLKFTADGEFLLQIGRTDQSGGSNDTENLGRPASIEVDPVENEVYIADGYGNRRVIVFDSETGEYKRHWGAYGARPDDTDLPPYDPEAEPIRHFRSPGARRRDRDRRPRVCGRPDEQPPAGLPEGWPVRDRGVRAHRDARQWLGVRRDPV